MSIMHFGAGVIAAAGAGGIVGDVQLTNRSISISTYSDEQQSLGYRLGSDGNAYYHIWIGYNGIYTLYSGNDWLRGGTSSHFSVRATVTSGTWPSFGVGTFGSWLNLGSNREWYWDAYGSDHSCVVLFELRHDATNTTVASASVTFSTDTAA